MNSRGKVRHGRQIAAPRLSYHTADGQPHLWDLAHAAHAHITGPVKHRRRLTLELTQAAVHASLTATLCTPRATRRHLERGVVVTAGARSAAEVIRALHAETGQRYELLKSHPEAPTSPRTLTMIEDYDQLRTLLRRTGDIDTALDMECDLIHVLVHGRGVGIHVLIGTQGPGSLPTRMRAQCVHHVHLRAADQVIWWRLLHGSHHPGHTGTNGGIDIQ